MLRLGHSSVRITKGLNATGRSHALLHSSSQRQHGMSMLRLLGPGHGRANGSSPGGSSELQGAHGVSSSRRSSVFATSNTHSAFSAAHLSTPKRLMSTAVGGGDPPHAGDTASATSASAGDLVGPDAMAGAADAAMAAAGVVDQVRYGSISRCRSLFTSCLSIFGYTYRFLVLQVVPWVPAYWRGACCSRQRPSTYVFCQKGAFYVCRDCSQRLFCLSNAGDQVSNAPSLGSKSFSSPTTRRPQT